MPAVTVALACQKGGVGKTTTAAALADQAAAAGMRVLAVDLDPQGNLSTALGVEPDPAGSGSTVWEVLAGTAESPQATVQGRWGHGLVHVLPADVSLAASEQRPPAPQALRQALAPLGDLYDLVLLDCPPSLGVLTLNGMSAADQVVVVATAARYAGDAVVRTVETVQIVQEHYNPALVMAGVVITMMPARGREAEHRLAELRAEFGADLWEVIPRRSIVEDAAGAGVPLSSLGAAALSVTQPYGRVLTRILATATRTPPRRRQET